MRESAIRPIFGRQFAATLSAEPVGEWVGPIPSELGLHIVYIDARVAGRVPQLDEIESEVEERWRDAKRSAAVDNMYQRLTESYRITIE